VNTANVIAALNVMALVAIMLSMGMAVRFEAVWAAVQSFRPLVLGLLANYLLVPLFTLGLLLVFQANPMVSVGFFILAVCPGAPVGPPITAVARGDVPWAIGMMLILAVLSPIVSPALLSVFLPRIAPESDLHIDALAIARVLLISQMLPLALGLGIHHGAPRLTERIVKPLNLFANMLLVCVVGLIVATHYETLAAIRVRGWTGMTLLLLASLVIGWFCGGRDVGTRKALAATTATRNAAVGLLIVMRSFADTPAVTAVVAYGLLSILGTLGCTLLFTRLTRIEAKNPTPRNSAG
jgi:BASS family bile acid:Na+ symporter